MQMKSVFLFLFSMVLKPNIYVLRIVTNISLMTMDRLPESRVLPAACGRVPSNFGIAMGCTKMVRCL
jgi:hypothetical protein